MLTFSSGTNNLKPESDMEKKTISAGAVCAVILAVCVAAAAGYFAGKSGEKQIIEEQQFLQSVNRSSIENLNIGNEGPIYVIGHKNPDSDTVLTAMAYARLLTKLGYEAEARITGPVNRETEYILQQAGVDIPPELEDASGCNIFLVDHSEYAQSAPGMKDAHIVGILDHHGVGTVVTGHQVVYEARPIGATATITWLDYLNYGVEIDKETAFLLLGAVLSDTYNLSTSTVTDADREAIPALAGIAEVSDIDSFYNELHAAALSYEGMSSEEILFSDYKEYEAGNVKFGIGLISAADEDKGHELAERMKEVIPEGIEKTGADLMYAAVSIRYDDVKTDLIVPADEHSAEVLTEAFPDYDDFDGTAYIYKKGLGRKSVFVPGLTDFLEAHPQDE